MYKLSLWEDNLDSSLETLLTPLASSEIKAPTRAYNLVLKHNINGQKTLTFEIFLKYFDINENKLLDNPLAAMVCNERRLKLFYDDEWYDFVIKSVQESSDKMTASITATDLFINELSRNGFEIELNQQLFNNQGTAPELGEKVLDGTDWSINFDECDKLIQVSEEVCYECEAEKDFRIESILGTMESNIVYEQDDEVIMDYSNGINKSSHVSLIDGLNYYPDWSYITLPGPIHLNEIIHIEFDYMLESPDSMTYALVMYFLTSSGTRYSTSTTTKPVYTKGAGHIDLSFSKTGAYETTQIFPNINNVQAGTKFKMTVSNLKITVDRVYDSTKKVPLTYTTKKFYLPYSTYTNKEDPAQIIVIDDNLKYDSDDEVALYSSHNCFAILDAENDKINSVSFTKKLSTTHRVEKILESPKIWYDERLGSIVNLYEGDFDSSGETKQLYCYEKKEVISPAINQNWIVNSRDFNSEWGWEGVARSYSPDLNVATLDEFLNSIKVLSSVLNVDTKNPIIYNNNYYMLNEGLFYYRDDIGELTKGEELICKIRLVDGALTILPQILCPVIATLNIKNEITGIEIEGELQSELSTSNEKIYKITLSKNISFDDLRDKKYSFAIRNSFPYEIAEVQLYRWKDNGNTIYQQDSTSVSFSVVSDSNYYSLITGQKRNNTTSNPFPITLNYPITNKETIKLEFTSSTNMKGQFLLYMKKKDSTNINIGRSTGIGTYTAGIFQSITIPVGADDLFSTTEIDICFSPSEDYEGSITDLKLIIGDRTIPASLGDYFEPYIDTTYMFYDLENSSFTNKEDFPSVVQYTYKNELPSSIKLYNNDYLKVKSITAAESNRLNIIQSISEAFECWTDFQITRDSKGRVLKKQIAFKKYIERDNAAGIRYGLNLQSTTRTLDSNNLTTKMIVKDNSNEFATNNFCSIARSKENPTRQKVLYDFDYYIKQQILDRNTIYNLLYVSRGLGADGKILPGFFEQWREYGEQEQELSSKYSNIALQYDKAVAAVTLNETSVQSAKTNFTDYNSVLVSDYGGDYNYYMNNLDKAYERKDDSLFISYLTKCINANKMLEDNENQLVSNRAIRDKLGAQLEAISKELTSIRANKNKLDIEFYGKFARFLQEGSWISEDYIDDTEYYLNAANVLHTSAFPKITYTFSVIDISGVEGYNFYEYKPGDKTWVQDTLFFGWTDKYKHNPVREEVVISEITSNLDDESKNTITVQNYKTQFEDLFQRITAATQTIELNKGAYNRAVIASTNRK